MATIPLNLSPTSLGHSAGPGRLSESEVARAARWLAAEPGDVLSFVPVTSQDEVPVSPDGRALPAVLASWQRRITRRRAVAVARRWILVAVALAFVCVLVNRLLLGLPTWLVIAVPAAIALGGAIATLRRPLSLDAVARLLDRELLLQEQVASALEVTEGRARGTNGALYERLEARVLAMLGDARRGWAVRLAPARGEWLSVLALAIAVALLLLAPHASTAPRTGVASPHPAAVSTASAPSQIALAVPTLPAQGHLPVQLSVAVVSTPAPRTTTSPASGPRPGQLPQVLAARPHGIAPPEGARVPASSGKGAKASGQSGGQLPGAKGAPAQPQQGGAAGRTGTQGSSLSVYNGSNRRRLSPAPGAQSGSAQHSSSSGPVAPAPGAAGKSAGASPAGKTAGSGKQSGANGPAGALPYTCFANPQACGGGAPPGAQALPYGGGLHLTPSQLPKPGLIEKGSNFQGKGTPGGSSAGQQAGSQGQAARLPKLNGNGRQFTLQSQYGAGKAGTPSGKTTPGQGTGTSGHAAAGGGPGGLQVLDYVPADANVVAPGARAIVSTYFIARAAQQ